MTYCQRIYITKRIRPTLLPSDAITGAKLLEITVQVAAAAAATAAGSSSSTSSCSSTRSSISSAAATTRSDE